MQDMALKLARYFYLLMEKPLALYLKKQKGRLWVHETQIFEVIFVTLTEYLLVIPNDTQGPLKYPTLVSLLLGDTLQSENTYFCILKVTGKAWKSQKR